MRWIQLLALIAAAFVAGCSTPRESVSAPGQEAQIVLTAPAHRLVYQRGTNGQGALPIAGTCAWGNARIEARVMDATGGHVVQTWTHIGGSGADGRFSSH